MIDTIFDRPNAFSIHPCPCTHSPLPRDFLKEKIIQDFKINCVNPPNGCTVSIQTNPPIQINISLSLLKNALQAFPAGIGSSSSKTSYVAPTKKRHLEGILVARPNEKAVLYDAEEAARELRLRQHRLNFRDSRFVLNQFHRTRKTTIESVRDLLARWLPADQVLMSSGSRQISFKSVVVLHELEDQGSREDPELPRIDQEQRQPHKLIVSWSHEDDETAEKILSIIDTWKQEIEAGNDEDAAEQKSGSGEEAEK